MAISTRMSRNPVTPSAQSPSIGARPSSSRPSSVKNSMAASMSSTTMPTLSIRLTVMMSPWRLTFAITGARRSCVRPRGLRCPASLRFHADGGDPSLSEHAFLLLTPVAENRCRSRVAFPLELRCQVLPDEFKRWIALVARSNSNFGKTRCCEMLPELSASTHVAAVLGLQCHVCLDGARQFRRRRRQNESAPVGTTHANDTSGFQDSAKLAQRRYRIGQMLHQRMAEYPVESAAHERQRVS